MFVSSSEIYCEKARGQLIHVPQLKMQKAAGSVRKICAYWSDFNEVILMRWDVAKFLLQCYILANSVSDSGVRQLETRTHMVGDIGTVQVCNECDVHCLASKV